MDDLGQLTTLWQAMNFSVDDLAKRIVNAKRGIEEQPAEEVPEAFKQ